MYSPLLNIGGKTGFLNQECSRTVCWGR